MDLQWIVVLIAIAAASAYLVRRAWRVWRSLSQGGCGGGCGCATKTSDEKVNKPAFVPADKLMLRKR